VIAFIGWLLAAAVVVCAAVLLYCRFRSPSDLNIAQSVEMETWTAVPADEHHSNTDLFKFKGQYIMVHASSPWHFASKKCRLVIRSSEDGKHWRVLAEIRVPGEDVRDPTMAEINGMLFLYFFPNMKLEPLPYTTLYCCSDDAVTWSEPKPISIVEWLLWRPRTTDGITFYAPAYKRKLGAVTLFKTTDGVDWSEVSTIYEGDKASETDLIFRPDGTMICAARIEMSPNFWGHHPNGHTVIGTASPPYAEWKLTQSYATRLDGPCLFQVGDRTYACGRRHVGGPKWMGSCWGRKRTSLYLVEPDRLKFLSDLPSCGDTAYAGAVVDDDSVLICYYTSPPGRDWFWLMGMLSNSSIEMARIKSADLEKLAQA
jgi:hypothetical protein